MLGQKDTEVKISTILGSDAECTGNFSAKGSVRLDGKVSGDVTVTGKLIIGATGSVYGNITAASVMIGGEVQGDVNAPEKTELTSTARVFGDISTKVIVIDENAVFQGGVNMNQEASEKRQKPSSKAVCAGKKSAKAAIEEALKEVEEEAKREETAAASLQENADEPGNEVSLNNGEEKQ